MANNDVMRKRGWSVHSEHTAGDTTVGSDDRSLSHEEKRLLLDSIPTTTTAPSKSHDEDEDDGFSVGDAPETALPSSSPPNKRLKLETNNDCSPNNNKEDNGDDNDDHDKQQQLQKQQQQQLQKQQQQERMLTLAKTKLSKWAARLFDPNRPRGLIEPPQTIPLNDEFLQAFGKREKEFDSKVGRTIDIDVSALENANDDDDTNETPQKSKKKTKKELEKEKEGRKLKITNMAYRTTEETLQKTCEVYGPLEEVNLIMNKENASMNAGRAYVTFESVEAASACLKEMDKLDGRSLNITLPQAIDSNRGGGTGGGGGGTGAGSGPARYWEKDISTKCFRCGQVGHMASSCPNEAKAKPCPLCAGIDHEMWSCPFGRICFNCGVPGHVNRDCPQPRGLPKRLVCGTCFQSGHHRVACHRRSAFLDVSTREAKCMVCHQFGHFMCQDMKWFFGLEGVSCFNCGRNGHHGYDCERPGLDICARDETLIAKEIDMAESESVMDELNQALGSSRGRSGGRGRQRENNNNNRDFQQNRNRARSQPPPREYGRGYDNNNERRGGGGGGNRRTSPPPPCRGYNDDRRSSSGSASGNYNNYNKSGRGQEQQQRGYNNNNNNNRGYNGGGQNRRGYR